MDDCVDTEASKQKRTLCWCATLATRQFSFERVLNLRNKRTCSMRLQKTFTGHSVRTTCLMR